jgi:hypothetical protein
MMSKILIFLIKNHQIINNNQYNQTMIMNLYEYILIFRISIFVYKNVILLFF